MRAQETQMKLRPRDIVILLAIHLWDKNRRWRVSDLSEKLGISVGEISGALQRTQVAGLFNPVYRTPIRDALREFLLFGLKYAFPAEVGEKKVKGIPTAHSAKPLSNQIVSAEEDQIVWPSKKGKIRGFGVVPLYPEIPEVAAKDASLHEMLALIDALRVGRARERNIAKEEIEKRILGNE